MNHKPTLSFWQIWNMCFGFLGIQFGFALQNTNVSRVFQTLGASIDDIPILWIAGPVTGLLVQPIIGYWSDKTWTRLGRRKPFMLYGAIIASLSLFIMPHSPVLWVAAGMLWVLDASMNITMEPFRAFVGDMLPDEQRATGFTLQSFFIGIGAVVASALPWIFTNWLGISNTAAEGIIPDSVIYSFYCGAVVYIAAVLWTVSKTREYTPEQVKIFEAAAARDFPQQVLPSTPASSYQRRGLVWLTVGLLAAALVALMHWDKQLFIFCALVTSFGVLQLLAAVLHKTDKKSHPIYQITHDLFQMPRTMKQLAVVQFFSWTALFSLWIYAIPAVTSYHYGTTDTTSSLYNDGADWVSLLFASYNGFAALAALVIPFIVKFTNRKTAHIICLLLGAAAFISFYFIKDPRLLMVSMVGVGFAWASILAIPYAILSGALPLSKMGIYIGFFNFFIVIPQILAASLLGLILREVFSGDAIYILVAGGVSFVLAAIATVFVDDKDRVRATP